MVMRQERPRWALWLMRVGCFVLLLGAGPVWAAPPPAGGLALKEARALVEGPEKKKRATTSLGFTNNGQLVHAAALPTKGKGYGLMGHVRGRGTHYGTTELLEVIDAATARVTAQWPGSRLAIGNLGFKSGEKIPWSVSHQAGRDADLGMYARTPSGKPLEGLPFVKFGPDGKARWRGETVVFDVQRNLALVRALVEPSDSRVQYLFVARWLKDKLLAEAGRQKLGSALIARLGEVMHQPSDSSPHDDHFHLRLFCTIEDRLFGCQDRGPRRAWVDMGDAVVSAHIAKLGQVLQPGGQPDLAMKAVARLAALRHPEAAPHLLAALERPEAPVRKAALVALATTSNPEVAMQLLDAVATKVHGAGLEEVLDVVLRLSDATLVDRVLMMARDPDAHLPRPTASPKGRKSNVSGITFRRFIIRLLARHGHDGQPEVIDALATLAAHPDPGIAQAAHDALRQLTCHFIAKPREWTAEKARIRAAASDPARHIEVIGRSLNRFDSKIPENLRSRRAVDRLVRVLDHRDEAVRLCASRALSALTGHDADPRARPPQRHRRHWENWWRDNRDVTSLPL